MKIKLIFGVIISVFLSVNVYSQVENELSDEYKEAEYKSQKDTTKKDPRSNPSKKVCDPYAKIDPANTFIIGNLEVMKEDLVLFGEYDKIWFTKAQELCKSLGEGWRLPNEKELKIIFHKKQIIGGFKDEEYWFDKNDGTNAAYKMSFFCNGKDDGKDNNPTYIDRRDGRQYTSSKFDIQDGYMSNTDEDGAWISVPLDAHVRAVRSIK